MWEKLIALLKPIVDLIVSLFQKKKPKLEVVPKKESKPTKRIPRKKIIQSKEKPKKKKATPKKVKPTYEVKIYKGNYKDRQLEANKDKAICYIEQHFNAAASKSANYSVVITAYNSSLMSRNMGKYYSKKCVEKFKTKTGGRGGILIGGYKGRGNYNLKFTDMPAILLEPLFCSTPRHAKLIKSDAGVKVLARVLASTVKRFFPEGGLVAFSIGHKYKRSKPKDRGARIYGGGTEADYAEKVMEYAKKLLEA